MRQTSKEYSDQFIFSRIKKGDEQAFEQVFKTHYVYLTTVAKSFVHDIDLAESIVQNVFVKLWENKDKYDIHSLKAYLVIAVRNTCHNELKRLKHERFLQKTIGEEELVTHVDYSDTGVIERIHKVINLLPEQRRKIFKLNRLDGLKYREIAEMLNISPKTVEVQMGKALKFLREHLLELKKQIYHMLW